MKTKRRIKRSTYYLVTIFLILFLSLFFVYLYNKLVSGNLKQITEQMFQKEVYKSLDNTILKSVIDSDITDLLKVDRNKVGEILYVDYDLQKSYDLLLKASDVIKENLNEEKGFVIRVPFMVISNNVLFNNFGPQITVRINYINTVLTNIYTKITNYGLNNALIEAYIKISVEGKITTPVSVENQIVVYDLLIASKVINGRVPSIYGDYLMSNSSIFDIPIE